MKKFVLVPFAQFQQDKGRAEEISEKEDQPAADLEERPREASPPPSPHSPTLPNDTTFLQRDGTRGEETAPIAGVQREQENRGHGEISKQKSPQISAPSEGIKSARVKRKRKRQAPPSKKIKQTDLQQPSSVEEDKKNGRMQAALQSPSQKFWIRP